MVKKTTLLALAATLFGSVVSANEGHKCTHDTMEHPEPEILNDIEEDMTLMGEGRTLADYPNLRMASYTGALADQSQEFQDYITNDILPPALSYFSNALKVKAPFTAPLKFKNSQQTICGISTPAEVKQGLPADFYYLIAANYDDGGSWVADTYSCFLSGATKRPYVARTKINTAMFFIPNNNVLQHEKNMICIMHELTHALGFASALYQHFLDVNGTKLTNHIQSATLDFETGTVINVEPLTTKLRKFFGCTTLQGAYMEAGGGSGTAGSHFERRQFGFEFMTSGLIYQMQISQFTLAMLEGSGWYVPDYSYADAYLFGQGQGCSFLTGSCAPGVFDEWCSGSTRGCTNVGRGGAECAADIRSNGCRFQHPRINYDCENEDAINYSRLPQAETYGRSSGAKCFMGTLTTAKSASSTNFCFKPTCSGSGRATSLTINVGGNIVKCVKEQEVTVPGFNGVLNCPDPIAFCRSVGQKICPRGCHGRGQCVEGVCVCQDGFKGTDCALRADYDL